MTMTYSRFFVFKFLVLFFFSCNTKEVDYELISTFQDHSIPEINMDVSDSTRVLVIMPHADDETIAGGLIAFLNTKGASIQLLTLCGHNETRVAELECSASHLGIEKVEIAGFVNNTWDDILNDNILFWYDHQDSISGVINEKINSYQPHILITYDSEIGGYGHPEHRISAKLTEDIFQQNNANPEFTPHTIFQITLSEKLEEFLVSKSPGYELAMQRTNSAGLPKPDGAIDISPYWEMKNSAAQCHLSQIRILKRFFIVYDEEHKDKHINAFSKEYYRIVSR
jgi:LmbE family N-acetylglucosaminyl deacetylase